MAPFAIVAPLIGPFLDRFRHGRRWAIGVTLAVRAFLCWVLADVLDSSIWLFPVALGCLVASKAFLVTQASAVPRLLPENFTLVNANSRISMAKVAGAAVGGGIAAAIAQLGPEWSLRFGFAVFIAATVLAILLSPKVDSTEGERDFGGVLLLRPRAGARPGPAPTALPQPEAERAAWAEVRDGRPADDRFPDPVPGLSAAREPDQQPRQHAAARPGRRRGRGRQQSGHRRRNLLKNHPPERIGLVVLAVDAAMAVVTAASTPS